MEEMLGALHADPWATSVIDLPELNQPASALIEERIAKIRDVAISKLTQLRSESLVLLGPPGTGKTHLFSRVRGRLGPRAIFVHIRPLLHAGLTPSYVLGQAIQQLAQPSYGRSEPQSDMLVGSLIGYLEDQSADFPGMNISTFRELSEVERGRALEQLTDKLFAVFPDLDDVFVERLLALPFATPRDRRALLAWLSGHDCDPSQLARIGATASMDPGNAVRALRTLTSLAALGAPLVIVFDQLENLVQRDGTEERITQYGNLVAELVDSTRGLLVVQLALDSEWEQAIAPLLNMSQRSRLVMGKAALSLPTSKQSRALIELWCGKIQEPGRAFPWPLSAEQLERLCALPGITPRMLLSALKEAREGSEPSILQQARSLAAPGAGTADGETVSGETAGSDAAIARDEVGELALLLAAEWAAQLGEAHAHLDQADQRGGSVDEGRLRDGLQLASSFAPEVALKSASDPYIQLEPKSASGRWVCLLHQSHFRSVQAALDRVLLKSSATGGLVVREQWRAFPPTWKAAAERQVQVLAKPHLSWHEMLREEAACLLAIEALLQLARSRDICDSRGIPVTETQVFEYLQAEVHPEQWPAIARLNRNPSAHSDEDENLETETHEPQAGVVTSETVRDVVNSTASVTEPSAKRPSLEVAVTPSANKAKPSSRHDKATAVASDGKLARAVPAPERDATTERVLDVLRRLRVASVDRVIREVHRLQSGIGRSAVLSGLETLGDRVLWFGRSIVALQDELGGTNSDTPETKHETEVGQ